MLVKGRTAIDGLSGSGGGTASPAATIDGEAGARSAFPDQSSAAHVTRQARTGLAMFLSSRLPRSSKPASSRPATALCMFPEIRMPPPGAAPSRRTAMFTPSP